MFTIKLRTYVPSAMQSAAGYPNYDTHEQLHGPFDLVSQEMEDGCVVVHAHRGGEAGTTFGAFKPKDLNGEGEQPGAPRPKLWVMNEAGATVATYDL